MTAAPCLYVETSRALPLVSIAIAVRTGAASDPEDKDGLTRVMARMLRRGCTGLGANAIEERIDSLGAELAVDLSSSMLTVHADVISRSLDPFVDLLARIVAEPSFDQAELGRLLRETEGEIVDARDNDRALATRHFRRVLFQGHPYGRRAGGRLATIASITRSDVIEQYARCFVRGNLAFAFSGDIDEERARKVADRIAAGLPEGPGGADGVASPGAREGRRLVFVDKPDRSQTQILVGTVGSHPSDDDHIPMHVATTIFGGTFTSRLMHEIRSKRGWSYGAYARLPYDKRRDAFTVWTFPAAKDAAPCLRLEIDMLQTWRDKGVLPKELAFAKRYLVRSHAFDIDTPQKRVHQRLDIELFDLPADHFTHYVEHVEEVTAEGAGQAVARRIPTDGLVIAVVGTHAEIGAEIAAAIPDLSEVEVVPYDAD
jgi:zinc protease